jgi:HlyD family secretion protein
MHPNPRRIAPFVIILLLLAFFAWYLVSRASANTTTLSTSGTIEASQVHISPEIGGRVTSVNFKEGDQVKAGDVLVELDASVLTAQRAQAAAGLAAAKANASAAQANLALLRAGPSTEQLAVPQKGIDQAQLAVDQANSTYNDLPAAAVDSPNAKTLQQAIARAKAALASAQAQYDLLKAGARPEQVSAAQAAADAAQGQAQAAQAALDVLDAQLSKLTLKSPLTGVVLTRSIEPGEFSAPGGVLLVIGQLDALTVTVYVPEDRYGQITLGQIYPVTVDSFPSETFQAKVIHIADQAEFTPRNVQSSQNRKTTVFAIRLAIDSSGGKLKPGMPVDLTFSK